MILPNRIKELRESRKLTQKEISLLTGKDETLVSMHENMKRPLNHQDILAYSKIFKIETHELFIGVNE